MSVRMWLVWRPAGPALSFEPPAAGERAREISDRDLEHVATEGRETLLDALIRTFPQPNEEIP